MNNLGHQRIFNFWSCSLEKCKAAFWIYSIQNGIEFIPSYSNCICSTVVHLNVVWKIREERTIHFQGWSCNQIVSKYYLIFIFRYRLKIKVRVPARLWTNHLNQAIPRKTLEFQFPTGEPFFNTKGEPCKSQERINKSSYEEMLV